MNQQKQELFFKYKDKLIAQPYHFTALINTIFLFYPDNSLLDIFKEGIIIEEDSMIIRPNEKSKLLENFAKDCLIPLSTAFSEISSINHATDLSQEDYSKMYGVLIQGKVMIFLSSLYFLFGKCRNKPSLDNPTFEEFVLNIKTANEDRILMALNDDTDFGSLFNLFPDDNKNTSAIKKTIH